MADDFVEVAPDSTGKKIDNTTVVTGAGSVYRQRTSLGDAVNNYTASISSGGAVKVDGSGATQPVSGAVTIANLDVALSTRTKPADQQHAIVDSGTLTAVTAITNPLPSGTNVLGHVITDTGSTVAVSNLPATQVVSGTVALSGPALESLQALCRVNAIALLTRRRGLLTRRRLHA